ncbi:unnamed protein product [Oppiella nova]|uniref:Uncharacterized protein n=1 Tax=Oppiella nova TaxID=334625 RepID=A0A7R9MIG1_9ACAR|nr:unnamed protein product [Oppiella nova]CAG2177568.1 unnamed protein product [Oppiella nova]
MTTGKGCIAYIQKGNPSPFPYMVSPIREREGKGRFKRKGMPTLTCNVTKDSLDRFGDDLCEYVLSFLSLEESAYHNCNHYVNYSYDSVVYRTTK